MVRHYLEAALRLLEAKQPEQAKSMLRLALAECNRTHDPRKPQVMRALSAVHRIKVS